MSPGLHPATEDAEQLAAYSDLQADGTSASDVDWYAVEFDRIAEQTLGGTRNY